LTAALFVNYQTAPSWAPVYPQFLPRQPFIALRRSDGAMNKMDIRLDAEKIFPDL
jgi:hypothetical protein